MRESQEESFRSIDAELDGRGGPVRDVGAVEAFHDVAGGEVSPGGLERETDVLGRLELLGERAPREPGGRSGGGRMPDPKWAPAENAIGQDLFGAGLQVEEDKQDAGSAGSDPVAYRITGPVGAGGSGSATSTSAVASTEGTAASGSAGAGASAQAGRARTK